LGLNFFSETIPNLPSEEGILHNQQAMATSSLQSFYDKVDASKEYCISKLAEAVAIKSVSADTDRIERVFDMANYLKKMDRKAWR